MGQNRGSSKSASVQYILDTCSMELSRATIVPSTLTIFADTVQIRDYKLNNRTVHFTQNVCQKYKGRRLTFKFRTFGFDMEAPFFTIDSSQLTHQELMSGITYDYNPFASQSPVIQSQGLDYRGSFARGLSIGNNQSLVPNSNFDMQLMGDLGNGLQVVAAISDNNLPIQAQGNTQQLQEFDKVFIQVKKDRHGVVAGDYELRRPDSYFMNYFKKLKGVSVSTQLDVSPGTELYTKGSFAISRGKFARQTLPIREGNQGPYRLTGNNNERFIIILAGTEKVFFNGILLTRGFDYDYVIDYNRAEIIFSPQRVIARDSRVIIEFEYTDIRYLRSLYATESVMTGKKWKAGFHFYSEQDSKTTTSDVPLDSMDISIMALSGDNLNKSVRSGIRPLDPASAQEQNRILYAGEPDPLDPANIILKFTTNLDSARYSAVFSEVGQGRGDYNIDPEAIANSRVYVYAGKNQGSYMPVIRLIPPEQRQMLTANARYDFNKNTHIFAEMALSYLDYNRLSSIDNGDNAGLATHMDLGHSIQIDSAGQWELSNHIRYEFVQEHFSALNPFRPPEFTRDWNIELLSQKGHEHLLLSSFQLAQKNGWKFKYGYKRFDKNRLYLGGKHEGIVEYQSQRWNIRSFTNILQSESGFLDEKTTFIRPNGHIYYSMGKNKNWTVGYIWDTERNVVKGLQLDTLNQRSYEYVHHKWFLGTDENKEFSSKVTFSVRDDYFSKLQQLSLASRAYELEVSGKWTTSANSHLEWSMIGRELKIWKKELLPNDRNQRTLLGRLDYNVSAFNKGIRSTTSYNTYAGQEPRVEYVFHRVERGQGDYIYIGNAENPNLTIVQDFRYDPSNPLSEYIRLTLINNEFIRTNNIELNQNITLEPGKIFSGNNNPKSRGQKFLSKLSTLSTMRLTKKQLDNIAVPLSSFIDFTLKDTSLVAFTSLNNHTLFFNRGHVRYDMQMGRRSQKNRVVQISGREDRGLDEWFLKSRWNVFRRVDVFMNVENNIKFYGSEILPDRNLEIESWIIRPEMSIRPTQNSRIVIKYTREKRQQRLLLKETASISDFSVETSVRKTNTYSLDARMSFVSIAFTGAPNSPMEFDMLNGLKNGQNFLWNMVYTKRISKNIDLTVNYEGRKTGLLNTIHVGRAQIKATF